MSHLFYLAAAMIIDPNDRLLVVRKRHTEKYMLPGGKIESGETPIDALIRELAEEVDLHINASDAEYIDQYRAPAANEPGFFIQSNLFKITLSQSIAITPEAEIEEAIWVTYEEACLLNLAPMMLSYVLPLWQGQPIANH